MVGVPDDPPLGEDAGMGRLEGCWVAVFGIGGGAGTAVVGAGDATLGRDLGAAAGDWRVALFEGSGRGRMKMEERYGLG